jgi:Tol biopolymer transport system component
MANAEGRASSGHDGTAARASSRAKGRKTGACAFVTGSLIFVACGVGAAPPEDGTGTPGSTSVAAPSAAPSLLHVFHYVDLRTGATSPLPDNIADSWSLLSPDGQMFVYGRNDSVFVANVDGSNERQITPRGVRARLGGWSPDGSMVVYQGGSYGLKLGNVFTVDLATGATTRLTDLEQVNGWTGITDMEPAFSPDGQTIFFHRPRLDARVWDIWSVPVIGGEPTIVRREAGWGRYSPDGRTLAFLSRFDDDSLSGIILIADAAGGPARGLVEGAPRTGPPIWSPDGTRIAFVGGGIRVVNAATGETSTVASCGGPVEWFDEDTLVVGPGGC